MKHVNTVVSDQERKDFLIDYVTNSPDMSFLNDNEKKFPAERPDFMVKFLVDGEKLEEAKDKLLADYNTWVRGLADVRLTSNDKTTGNVFAIVSFSHSDETYTVANLKIIQ